MADVFTRMFEAKIPGGPSIVSGKATLDNGDAVMTIIAPFNFVLAVHVTPISVPVAIPQVSVGADNKTITLTGDAEGVYYVTIWGAI